MSKADSASPISSIKHDDKTTFFATFLPILRKNG